MLKGLLVLTPLKRLLWSPTQSCGQSAIYLPLSRHWKELHNRQISWDFRLEVMVPLSVLQSNTKKDCYKLKSYLDLQQQAMRWLLVVRVLLWQVFPQTSSAASTVVRLVLRFEWSCLKQMTVGEMIPWTPTIQTSNGNPQKYNGNRNSKQHPTKTPPKPQTIQKSNGNQSKTHLNFLAQRPLSSAPAGLSGPVPGVGGRGAWRDGEAVLVRFSGWEVVGCGSAKVFFWKWFCSFSV